MRGLLLLVAGAAVASFAITALALRYALARGVLDHPNERSLHERPTPRGGGIGVVAVVLAFVAGAGLTGVLDDRVALALFGAGALVAAAGWIDDHVGASRGVRLLIHLVAAVWVVAWLGGMTTLSLGATHVELGHAGSAAATLLIAWLINLYNFMDGADGVAAGQAVVAGGAGGALLFLAQGGTDGTGLARVALVVGAAAFGFLLWNWQPARIFMGDTASGFLGLVFGALAVASETAGTLPLIVWLMLLGWFLLDATLTLVRRMMRGERWREAHRRHAYQRVIQVGARHATVAAGIMALALIGGALGWWALARPARLPLAAGAFGAGLTLVYLAIERRAPWSVGASGTLEPGRARPQG